MEAPYKKQALVCYDNVFYEVKNFPSFFCSAFFLNWLKSSQHSTFVSYVYAFLGFWFLVFLLKSMLLAPRFHELLSASKHLSVLPRHASLSYLDEWSISWQLLCVPNFIMFTKNWTEKQTGIFKHLLLPHIDNMVIEREREREREKERERENNRPFLWIKCVFGVLLFYYSIKF